MARAKGPRKVRRYDNAFKVKAVKLSQLPGVQVKDVAESLDVHPFMLSKWRKEVRDGVLTAEDEAIIEPRSSTELRRLRQLEQDHLRLKQEHELLKKAIRFCSDPKRRSLPS
jgi:transposase